MGPGQRAKKLQETNEYIGWFDGLRDEKARGAIRARVRQVSLGNWGDWKHVGEEVFEFRIHRRPGYRVYFSLHGEALVLLLGGTKGSRRVQQKDIGKARELARELRR